MHLAAWECFSSSKTEIRKLNNVGLFVFECISCTLHLHSRRYFCSGKELWCIHEAWQREKVSLSFLSFCTSCVEKNLLDIFGDPFALFRSDHLSCLPPHSWFYLFPISHKGRLYQGLSITIVNWPISQWTAVSDCGLFTDHRRIELLRASLSAPALTLENH